MIIRVAAVEDAAAIAEIHVRSWQQAYRGLLPQPFLDGLDPASRTPGWRSIIANQSPPTQATLVVAESEQIVGFAHICPTRDDDGQGDAVGELAAIYVHPDDWGNGRGRQLMDEALDLLRKAGNTAATLWVLPGNARAVGFYEANDWSRDGATELATIADTAVTEVRYRRTLHGEGADSNRNQRRDAREPS